jgi:hypothetical protein
MAEEPTAGPIGNLIETAEWELGVFALGDSRLNSRASVSGN